MEATMNSGDIVNEILDIAQNSSKMPGFGSKVLVDVDRLEAVASRLSQSITTDNLEAIEVLKQKDSILSLAQLEAERIREAADHESREMSASAQLVRDEKFGDSAIIKDAENRAEEVREKAAEDAQLIVQDAQRKAFRMVEQAESDSEARRSGADRYALEVLHSLEESMSSWISQVRTGLDSLQDNSGN
jgi:vacuolar-type H+-ATPase subunit E/Vma4